MSSGTITLRRPRVRGVEERFESRVLPLFARRTKAHREPLCGGALEFLDEARTLVDRTSPFLFPNRVGSQLQEKQLAVRIGEPDEYLCVARQHGPFQRPLNRVTSHLPGLPHRTISATAMCGSDAGDSQVAEPRISRAS